MLWSIGSSHLGCMVGVFTESILYIFFLIDFSVMFTINFIGDPQGEVPI